MPVSAANLRLAGGLAAIAGGLLWAVNAVLGGDSPEGGTLGGVLFLVPLLLGAGLAGLYLRYGEQVPGLGGAGFVQGFAGLGLLVAGFFVGGVLGSEGAVQLISFGFLILTFGLVLLGFAFLKNEPMPRLNLLPLALALVMPLSIIAGEVSPLRIGLSAAFGLGWAVLGAILLSDPGNVRNTPE